MNNLFKLFCTFNDLE